MAQFSSEQQMQFTINPKTVHGHPAHVDGVPVWKTDDPAVATVEAAADGLSATVKGVGAGTTNLSVTADADLGPGINNITESEPITITEPQASGLGLTGGTVTDQP